MGDDVACEGDAGSPGSGGASPYLRRGFPHTLHSGSVIYPLHHSTAPALPYRPLPNVARVDAGQESDDDQGRTGQRENYAAHDLPFVRPINPGRFRQIHRDLQHKLSQQKNKKWVPEKSR
jgi:hypothetical protein